MATSGVSEVREVPGMRKSYDEGKALLLLLVK